MTEPSSEPESKLEDSLEQSDLAVWVMETKEMYEELLAQGYPQSVSAQIIGHILYDVMTSRFEDDTDDWDTNDDGPFSG